MGQADGGEAGALRLVSHSVLERRAWLKTAGASANKEGLKITRDVAGKLGT